MKILFYEEEGQSPVDDFFSGIPKKIKARFHAYLKQLKEAEGRMEGVAFKKLHGYPLEEVRVKESKNLHRIIIKTKIGDSVIVLHGFTKREGEPTPKKELEIAYERYLKFQLLTLKNHAQNKC